MLHGEFGFESFTLEMHHVLPQRRELSLPQYAIYICSFTDFSATLPMWCGCLFPWQQGRVSAETRARACRIYSESELWLLRGNRSEQPCLLLWQRCWSRSSTWPGVSMESRAQIHMILDTGLSHCCICLPGLFTVCPSSSLHTCTDQLVHHWKAKQTLPLVLSIVWCS